MGKLLYVMRHGKSDWGDSGLTDFERGLKKRGKRDAAAMGRLILAQGPVPELVISSPARRARMTAKRFARACEYEGEIAYQASLYGGGVDDYLQAAAMLGEGCGCLVLLGHNPTCEELALGLTGRLVHVATANVLAIELLIESWRQLRLAPCRGILRHHLRPADASVLDSA